MYVSSVAHKVADMIGLLLFVSFSLAPNFCCIQFIVCECVFSFLFWVGDN